jgi:hypothetical protein
MSDRHHAQSEKQLPTMVQAGVHSSLIHYFKALEALGGNPHDGRAVVAKMPAGEEELRAGRVGARPPCAPSNYFGFLNFTSRLKLN